MNRHAAARNNLYDISLPHFSFQRSYLCFINPLLFPFSRTILFVDRSFLCSIGSTIYRFSGSLLSSLSFSLPPLPTNMRLLTRNCLRSDETNARNSVWFEAGQSPCSVSVPEPSVVRPLDCWKKEINELPRSPNKTSIICAGVAQFVTQDCACLILFDAASTQLRRPGSMVVRKTGGC